MYLQQYGNVLALLELVHVYCVASSLRWHITSSYLDAIAMYLVVIQIAKVQLEFWNEHMQWQRKNICIHVEK